MSRRIHATGPGGVGPDSIGPDGIGGPIEVWLAELTASVRGTGRSGRRLVEECREHLVDSAAVHGEEDAVRRIGPAAAIGEGVRTDLALRAAQRSTAAAVAGVLAVGVSSLAVVDGAEPRAVRVLAWAVVFFAAAQGAAGALLLAVLRLLAMRTRSTTGEDAAVLCRRNAVALGLALLTLLAAAAAVPGRASPWLVLAGPVMALIALVGVWRAHRLTRALVVELADAAPRGVRPSLSLLGPAVLGAGAVAFAWDRLDHGTWATSLQVAGTEAALAVVGLWLLAPALGWDAGALVRSVAARRTR